MKAYLAIKFYDDCRNRKKIEEISSTLDKNGVETVCIAKDFEKWGEKQFDVNELMRISFEQIDKSDFILVDLTEKGVGLGIEAGYAYAKKIPIVTIVQERSDISNTLKGISNETFCYKNVEDLNVIFSNENIKKILKIREVSGIL